MRDDTVSLEEFHRAKAHAADVCEHRLRAVAEECAQIAEKHQQPVVAQIIRMNFCSSLLPASIDVVGKAREEAQRRLAMVRGCLDCNADDARFWVAVIDFLKEMERC